MARDTRQKRAIEQAFTRTQRPLTPEEIRELASRDVPSLGIATVYRAVKSGVEEGWLKTVDLPGNSTTHFELAELDHHHHFSCNACGKVYDVAGCPGPLKDLAPAGFKVEQHEIVLYGICKTCNGLPGKK